MKTLITTLFLSLAVFSNAQTDCKPYVPVDKGTKWEVTNYSKKDKVTGTIKYELVEKIESGNDATFTIKATSFDKDGKQQYVNDYQAYCKDGKFEFDMDFMIDGSQMQAYQNMDVEVDATKFEVPDLDAAPGTALADGELGVAISSNGVTMFNMKVQVTDRKIEKKETLETSAGSFECIVLSQKVSTKMVFKVEGSSREWYAPSVGMVRSESYDKKGKLTGYSVLTSFTKP